MKDMSTSGWGVARCMGQARASHCCAVGFRVLDGGWVASNTCSSLCERITADYKSILLLNEEEKQRKADVNGDVNRQEWMTFCAISASIRGAFTLSRFVLKWSFWYLHLGAFTLPFKLYSTTHYSAQQSFWASPQAQIGKSEHTSLTALLDFQVSARPDTQSSHCSFATAAWMNKQQVLLCASVLSWVLGRASVQVDFEGLLFARWITDTVSSLQ